MSSVGRVLVTGASGFVGSAVAKCSPRPAIPSARWCATSARAPISTASMSSSPTGDLRDAGLGAPAMAGVRYLFHVAADYRLWARDPARDHPRPTSRAPAPSWTRRCAPVSSASSTPAASRRLTLNADGQPVDETLPLDRGERDRRLQAQQGRGRTPRRGDDRATTSCLPSSSIRRRRSARATCGRRRPAASSSRPRPAACRASSTPGSTSSTSTTSPPAISRRCEKGRIGERYILGGENVTFSAHAGGHRAHGRAQAAALEIPAPR